MKEIERTETPSHSYGLVAGTTQGSDGIKRTHVDITLNGQIIGSFDPSYGHAYSPRTLTVTSVNGHDFGIIAPEYYRVGIISLPDCVRTFETNPAVWNEDHCPLGFWTDPRIPGLVFVAWMEWGDPDYKAMATYFWVDEEGKMAGTPKLVGEFASWPEGGSMEHLFELESMHVYRGEWTGSLIVKTQKRRYIDDLLVERKHRTGLDLEVPEMDATD